MRFTRLPGELRERLEREAQHSSPGALLVAARSLSDGYRAGRSLRLDSEAQFLAYALTRLPATFGAVWACLGELGFQPHSLLDLGAGPGTALWAYQAHFGAPPAATCLEANPGWRPLAARWAAPEAVWRTVDLRTVPKLDPHELVVCSYVLNELNGLEQFRVLDAAWAAASRALLVVEPGTPEGFARIREMRRWLVEAGAAIAAPCPHDQQCPMEVPDWCHFAVRVERTRLHRLAKGGELGFEDEKFSYVLAVRVPSGSRAPRILRHPRVEAGRIQLSLCGSEGLTSLTVTKRDKVAWRAARKASWGGAWESARGDGAQDE